MDKNKIGIFGKKRLEITDIALLAMLTAAYIVISRFLSINTPYIKIGFSFLPVAIAARYRGVVGGAAVSALGDLIGALLFPYGPFFVGYTLTAALLGAVYGAALCREYRFRNAVFAVVPTQIICTLLLNSLWTSVLYAKAFGTYVVLRIPQSLIMTPIQILVIHIVLTALQRFDIMNKISGNR